MQDWGAGNQEIEKREWLNRRGGRISGGVKRNASSTKLWSSSSLVAIPRRKKLNRKPLKNSLRKEERKGSSRVPPARGEKRLSRAVLRCREEACPAPGFSRIRSRRKKKKRGVLLRPLGKKTA